MSDPGGCAAGAPLYTVDQVRDTIAGKRPGDRLKLHVYRGTDARTVKVELGRQPTTG